jgi:hypothetical protein
MAPSALKALVGCIGRLRVPSPPLAPPPKAQWTIFLVPLVEHLKAPGSPPLMEPK